MASIARRAYARLRAHATRRVHRGQRWRPPRRRPGFVVGPPDFVGVGEQKCGTTWWYRLIEAHPDVTARPGKPKELAFFRSCDPSTDPDALAAQYARWFPRQPGTLCGEWDPNYLTEPGTVAKLRRAAPAAKLLVLVRDPVERFRSAMTMIVDQQGNPAGPAAEGVRRRGEYRRSLDSLRREFPPDQVLVLQYELCVRETAEQLARTYAFLGLDPAFAPRGLFDRRWNPARLPRREMTPAEREALVRHYEPEVLGLAALIPDLRLDLWPNFAHLGAGRAASEVDPGAAGGPGPAPA